MTGFKSKKTAALDEDGMYLVHQTAQPALVKFKFTMVDDQHPQGIPLEQWGNTGKAQRPWVGLTDEEMQAVVDAQLLVSNINVYFKAIEAKLKEKNNGTTS